MPSPSSKRSCAKPPSGPLRAFGPPSAASSTSSHPPNAPTTSQPQDTMQLVRKRCNAPSHADAGIALAAAPRSPAVDGSQDFGRSLQRWYQNDSHSDQGPGAAASNGCDLE